MIKAMANELKETLSIMTLASGSDRSVETGSNIYFTGDELALFSGDAFIKKPFKTDFSGGCDSLMLKDIAEKYGVNEIEISREDNQIIVRMKRSISKLVVNDVNQFPEIEFSKESEWRKVPPDFSGMIDQCSQVCGNNMNEPIKTCIHLNGRFMEAGDGFQFAIFKMKGLIQDNIFIRKDFVKILTKFEPTEYRLSDSWICFKNSSDYFLAVRKVLIPDYPNLDQIFSSRKGDIEIELGDKVISSLERSKIFLRSELEFERFIRLQSKGGKLIISTETKSGSYKDVLPGGDKDFDIKINPEHLVQMLFFTNKLCVGESSVSFNEKNIKMAACIAE